MRWVVCVALLLALVPRAFAGDYDILRGAQPVGPATFTRWSGFYAGGQYGWSDANADFSNATSGPVAFALRITTLESAGQSVYLAGARDRRSRFVGLWGICRLQHSMAGSDPRASRPTTSTLRVTLKAQNNPIAQRRAGGER